MDREQALPTPDLLFARVNLAVQPYYDDDDIGAGESLEVLAPVDEGAGMNQADAPE